MHDTFQHGQRNLAAENERRDGIRQRLESVRVIDSFLLRWMLRAFVSLIVGRNTGQHETNHASQHLWHARTNSAVNGAQDCRICEYFIFVF